MLTASESTIYGRFGYGPATWRLGCSIDRVAGRFARPVGDTGRVRMVTRGEADPIYQEVYEQARKARAGMVSRPEFWWPEVFWVTEPGHAFFEAVHEDEHGQPDGYVSYEIKGEWHGGVADRQLIVWDIQAVELAHARRAVGIRVRRRSRRHDHGRRTSRPTSRFASCWPTAASCAPTT